MYLLGSEFEVYTANNRLTYLQSKSKLKVVEQWWAAKLASFSFKIVYCVSKHNTLGRIRWDTTHEHSTEDKEDAGMDTRENTTLTAEMLTRIAGTTRVLEDMQLGVLEDAIHVEELGVMKPADECADQCADEFRVFLEFS